MEQPYPVVEFEADVKADGSIVLPANLHSRIPPDGRIIVRVTMAQIAKSLRDKGVTEEEVEKIAAVQHEGRDNVLGFLQANGALAKEHSFSSSLNSLLGR